MVWFHSKPICEQMLPHFKAFFPLPPASQEFSLPSMASCPWVYCCWCEGGWLFLIHCNKMSVLIINVSKYFYHRKCRAYSSGKCWPKLNPKTGIDYATPFQLDPTLPHPTPPQTFLKLGDLDTLEGVWKLSENCLEGVWKVSGNCVKGVL